MIIFFAVIGILCLYRISVPVLPGKAPANGNYYTDYLSVEKTNAMKGVFILIVFLNHSCDYYHLSSNIFDFSYRYLLGTIGQSMVVPFLLYSGYGIMLSIEKKGQAYVNGIPYKRFFKVLLHFDIAICLFALTDRITHHPFTLKTFLLSLTGWEDIGNSNWYICVMLCLYLATFLAFSLFRKNRRAGLAFLFALCIGMMVIFYRYKYTCWYDTLLCYPFGMLWYYIHKPVEEWLCKSRLRYYLILIALLAGIFVFIFIIKGHFFTIVRHLLFALAFLMMTMRFSINNKILVFFGKNLFALFILQRIPMIFLQYFGITNPYLFVVLSFVFTVLLAIAFQFCLGKLDNHLFRQNKQRKSQ